MATKKDTTKATKTTKGRKKANTPVEEPEIVQSSLFGDEVDSSAKKEQKPLKTEEIPVYKAPTIIEIYDNIFGSKEFFENMTKPAKEVYVFPVNKRMAIKYPDQAQVLNIKNNPLGSYVIDFWSAALYNGGKKPFWMFKKGISLSQKSKADSDTIKIKESVFMKYKEHNFISTRDGEYLKTHFTEELAKELADFEEYLKLSENAQDQ